MSTRCVHVLLYLMLICNNLPHIILFVQTPETLATYKTLKKDLTLLYETEEEQAGAVYKSLKSPPTLLGAMRSSKAVAEASTKWLKSHSIASADIATDSSDQADSGSDDPDFADLMDSQAKQD